jgi:hypothetical protein
MLIATRPWLRVYQLPAYAPELNPVEKIWSAMKRSLGNLPARTALTLEAAVKNRLKKMQYRHGLIDGYLTGTGLSPPTPTGPGPERSLVARPLPGQAWSR